MRFRLLNLRVAGALWVMLGLVGAAAFAREGLDVYGRSGWYPDVSFWAIGAALFALMALMGLVLARGGR